MRIRARIALALAALALACSAGAPAPERIVLVTIDTLRADHVGCYGAERAHTPTLDALARDGVRFDAAMSPVPLTLPAHTTILTGLDPDRHGIRHNGVFALAPEIPTLAERMRASGYATAAFVGAFVLDHRFGLARGFDHYDDAMGTRHSGGLSGYAERRADRVREAFAGWLAQAPERFFAWVHVYDPHKEYDPPAGFAFARHPYDGEIAFVDAQLAQLLAAIDARFPREGTLVVVTSDHGESLGEHGEPTHSYTLHDATQRVPLIFSGPGFRGGRVLPDVVRLADLAPTLVAATGSEPLGAIDGRELQRVAAGGAPEISAYSETIATHVDFGWSALFSARDARWRYIAAPEPELYDLGADPAERRNVAAAHPDVAREHASWLDARRARAPAPSADRTISAEERAKLAALGYVVGAHASPSGDLSGPDPKRRIGILAALDRAGRLSESGRAVEAFEALAPYAEEQGEFVTSLRATLAIQAGQLDAAERDLEGALARTPDSASLLRTLALVKERRSDWAAARAIYERASAADPTDATAPTALGRIAEAQGDSAAAERHYRAALAISPGASDTTWRLAALRMQQGDLAGAHALVAEVEPPPDLSVAFGLAAFQANVATQADVARRLDEAIGTSGRVEPIELAVLAAAILEGGGRDDAALRVNEDALTREPGSWRFQNGVAWGLALQHRDLDRALELARAAEAGSGGSPEVLDTLAAVHLARKEAAPALGIIERALANAGPSLRAHLHYLEARALADLGRRKEAAGALRRSIDARASSVIPQQAEADALARALGVGATQTP